MSQSPPAELALGRARRAGLARVALALIETTKPGITRMVTTTAAVGLLLAAVVNWPLPAGELVLALLLCVLGTAACAGGANAINEWWERDLDARMQRTAVRPIPRGALRPRSVLLFGLILTVVGAAVLLLIGPVPAAIALACTVTYLLMYTPLKTRSPLSTLMGAVPGALPPLIGWTALRGPASLEAALEPGAIALFTLMFVWQLPHFLAIAWMYREDYERGGFRVLPVVDANGLASAVAVLVTATLLIPATLAPFWALPGVVSWLYASVAVATGLVFLALCLRLLARRTREAARLVFFASIVHLPVLLVVLVIDALL